MRCYEKQRFMMGMLSLCAAAQVSAEQAITPELSVQTQRQCQREMVEVQAQMDVAQREQRHVVCDPAVALLEAKQAQGSKRAQPQPSKRGQAKGISAQEKAEANAALQAFNAKIPEINAALAKASSNAPMPKIALKPMTADQVIANGTQKGKTSERTLTQQSINQMIVQQMQEAMKQADPASRAQMKAVMKAMSEGRKIPVPKNVPQMPATQIVPKGNP